MSGNEKKRTSRGRSLRRKAGQVLAWLAGSMTVAVLYYVVLSLFLSTDTEKRLIRENRMYARLYPELREKERLLEDATLALTDRDNAIYDQIFHTEAPAVDPTRNDLLSFEKDTLQESDLVRETERRAERLSRTAARVEEDFLAVFARLAVNDTIPPLTVPVANLTYAQIGATAGVKISPFSKVESPHGGLDIIAAQGTPVHAAADGTVTDIRRSGKGLGNVVTIDHGNGFVTRYAHLGDILVSRGQKVTRGRQIARVGISGKSFVPHLHYEVLRDGVPQNPADYFPASLSPRAYADVAYMAANTKQSLD